MRGSFHGAPLIAGLPSDEVAADGDVAEGPTGELSQDLEDTYLAEEALAEHRATGSPAISMEEVTRRYGHGAVER